MKPAATVVLLGGVAYLAWPYITDTIARMDPVWSTPRYDPVTGKLIADPRAPQPYPQAPGSTGPGSAAGQVAGIGLTAIAGAQNLGAILGLSAGIAAGIFAAGGILAWGIVSRGWFRGGEEALHVNRPRDEYKALFAHLNPYQTVDRNGPGFYGLAWLLANLNRSDLMTRFNQADTRRAFEAVTGEIDALIAMNASEVRRLVQLAATTPKV